LALLHLRYKITQERNHVRQTLDDQQCFHCQQHQPIIEVEQMMRENRIRQVPVVDNGKLVGNISREDLFRAMPSIFDPSISPETLDQAGESMPPPS